MSQPCDLQFVVNKKLKITIVEVNNNSPEYHTFETFRVYVTHEMQYRNYVIYN